MPKQSFAPHAGSCLQTLVHRLSWYYAINGVNILLLIARILKLMDFQPRLGVVTRSLALAGPDLIHFVLVCGMVFIGYAMMAHLIFGNTIEVGTRGACKCLLPLRLCLQSRSATQALAIRLGTMPRAHRQQHNGLLHTLGSSLGHHLVVQGSILVCPCKTTQLMCSALPLRQPTRTICICLAEICHLWQRGQHLLCHLAGRHQRQ